MRWNRGLMGAAFIFVSTLTFGAECAGDLVGEWNREAAPGGTPDDAYRAEGSGWSDRIRVTRDSGRINIESYYFSRTDLQPPLRFSYLPGESTENVVMVGNGTQRQSASARWNECRLVITTRHPAIDASSAETTVIQTLWLEADALVVETARGAAKPNRTLYRRVAVAGGK